MFLPLVSLGQATPAAVGTADEWDMPRVIEDGARGVNPGGAITGLSGEGRADVHDCNIRLSGTLLKGWREKGPSGRRGSGMSAESRQLEYLGMSSCRSGTASSQWMW